MRRARRLALVLTAVGALVAPAATAGGSGSEEGPTASKSARGCGTFASTSIFPRAKVIAIRGVKCGAARKVAKQFDRKSKQIGRWRCGLAHGSGRDLFSCGKGKVRGNLRKAPHALLAKGIPG